MPNLLNQKRVGAILRVFAGKPDQVANNVKQVLEAAQTAAALTMDGRQVFAKVLILVAADPAYPDCDCGETLPALRQAIKLKPGDTIQTYAIEKGDLFCGVLNWGVAKLLREGVDYGMILSHGAKSYLRPDTIGQMLNALEAGAKVTGIAIEELAPSILEGRIANTMAIWDLVALASVGGFDLCASQPRKDDPVALYVRGWNQEKGDVFYPRAGVEEIVPLIRLVQVNGACIAPVIPVGEAKWKEPDPATDPAGAARSRAKLETKFARQIAHALPLRVDLSFLKSGVMPDYRKF